MKQWDAIIVGAGIIGLSLAIELRKSGLSVLIVERGEPGREASGAAGGMLADSGNEIPAPLQSLATASAQMYPEFVHELEDESGIRIDLRSQGTLLFGADVPHAAEDLRKREPLATSDGTTVPPASLRELEPALRQDCGSPLFLPERSVDPRQLTEAAIKAAKHRGIDFSSRDPVTAIEIVAGRAAGVRTEKTVFAGGLVVNCAGAWAGQFGRHGFPTRPVKGQMLCVAMPDKELVQHVIRTPDVYLIPRSDGRLLIGATLEEAGFNKQTVPETIQRLWDAAVRLVPGLANSRRLEAWAGLRPGTPDDLPILGATETPAYFAATGHYRDGILLAPITAKVLAECIAGRPPQFDLKGLTAERFTTQ